jgi:hypothetical protein
MEQTRHISKASHNEDFWRDTNTESSKYPDWAVVGIFYSAMHYIDAAFAKNNKHLKSHDDADVKIGSHRDLTAIYDSYRKLKDYRWYASYWSKRFSKPDIDSKIIPHFNRIKTLVLDVLSNRATSRRP